jgi:hypothetical protein
VDANSNETLRLFFLPLLPGRFIFHILVCSVSAKAEAEREPVAVDAAPAPREDTSWTVLTDAGFQFIGEWAQHPESLIRLEANAPASPGVYAFIVDDIVVYIGLTLNGLKNRFDQYRRGHKGQKTSSRIKARISQTLAAGKKVKVLVATPETSEWQELPVNTAAGLEAGLIEMIRPSWNIRGAPDDRRHSHRVIPASTLSNVLNFSYSKDLL